MEVFKLTLNQMLVMFILIAVGFLLRKGKVVPKDSALTLSRLETYLFTPALNLSSMMANCSVQNFKDNAMLIVYGGILIGSAILLSYPLSKLFVKGKDLDAKSFYQRNIFRYALAFSNYGYVGNFLILSIWGSELLFKFQMLTFFSSVASASWGLCVLIPKDQNRHHPAKNLLTPPMIALVIGIILGLLDVQKHTPAFVLTALSNASSCMGPVAMVLAGVVIADYNIKDLINNKKVYAVSAFRLILIPSLLMIILGLLGTNKEIMTLVLILFAGPIGLNTIVYPSAFGGDVKTGASMTMVSHTLVMLTIPLMYLLWIVVL